MAFSRRKFIHWAASASTLALTVPDGIADASGFRPDLVPSQKETWDTLLWMAKLGPKYTGNPAHVQFVEFLAKNLQSLGLEVNRDSYTLPRWDAHRTEITIHPSSGADFKVPVTSYYPYSGKTPPEGVTGEIAYVGNFASIEPGVTDHTRGRDGQAPASAPPRSPLKDLQGKIAFVECDVTSTNMQEWFRVRGGEPSNVSLPADHRTPVWGTVGMLTDFKKAGALGVILGWTDISDENAADQYVPFGRAHQDMPALYVGRATSAKLRALAQSDAKATLVLEANVTPDSPTDTLYASLPGVSSDELIVVQSHTDGPNALEENGGIGVLALAKYFSHLPKTARKRTLLFVLTTGHFAGAYVPSIRGFVQKHPDIVKKTVASLTIEHLGGRDWSDDAAMHYRPTGKNEIALAQTAFDSTAAVMLEALKGSGDLQAAVVTPNQGHRWSGEGSGMNQAGVPSIGYITIPSYLCAGPANGCIERLSSDRMHAEIVVFAKAIHKMDGMSAAELKGAARLNPK
jgi:hypothetical protein